MIEGACFNINVGRFKLSVAYMHCIIWACVGEGWKTEIYMRSCYYILLYRGSRKCAAKECAENDEELDYDEKDGEQIVR